MAKWVEEHPWIMAWIVGTLVFMFALFYHKEKVIPNDWEAFAIWSPLCFLFPMIIAGISQLTEKK